MRVNPLGIYVPPYKQLNSKYQSNPISFGARGDDTDFLVQKYSNMFDKLVHDKRISKQSQKNGFDKLFDDLSKASDEVKAKFLLDINLTMGTVFDIAVSNSSALSWQIWNFVKENTSADIQNAFILGGSLGPDDTTFFKAAIMHEQELAADILKFVNEKTDVKVRRKFYNMNEHGKTQADLLEGQGLLTLANKFRNIAQNYAEPNEQNNQNKPNITLNKSDTVGNGANYRVYEDVKTKFADVGGMFNIKRQIQNELLAILKNPKVKNQDKPSGVILYGPPGTGKTLLATAIAGEAGVPFISTEGSSFNEKYVGVGAANVRNLYSKARYLAANHPSKTAIVFIDEVDAVGGVRGKSSCGENDNTLNALLSEMDGVKSKEDSDIKVITIVATNRKDLLDSAFRKGRIDLEFHIDDPRFSEKARYEILSIHAKDKVFENEEKKQKLLKELARTTSGFSGAELADLIKRAYRKTLYLGREKEYITEHDIRNAKLESIVGVKNDSEVTEYEQKQTISHEAGHAINLIVMDKVFENEQTLAKRPVRVLDLVVNESYGDSAGMTVNKPSEFNRSRITLESLLSSVVVTYGGYSVEERLFGCHTDGVSGDLQSNTEKIFNAVTMFGLGAKTKYLCVKPGGQVFDFYRQDIKHDIEAYSNAGMKIADMISEFTEPFIKEYTEDCFNNPVKVIPGDVFIKMFESWLKKNNKKEEYEQLCSQIRTAVDELRIQMSEANKGRRIGFIRS